MKNMNRFKIGKLNFHSMIMKFLPVFLLFGVLLLIITVAIQNDLAQTMTEELTAEREQQCLSVLENHLGDGEWNVRDGYLYKGDTPIGNGTYAYANIEPFLNTEKETSAFVYSFIVSSMADKAVLSECVSGGNEQTMFLRVAGSTLDANGNPIVGTFLDRSVSETLERDGIFTGRSCVEGRMFYCYYSVIHDVTGRIVGALVAGYSIDEIDRKTNQSTLNSSIAVSVIILYTFFAIFLFVSKWNRSIRRMESYLQEIGSGVYPKEPLKISGGDELSEMAGVINEMKLSLEEKERMRNELALAKTIQAEMLPDESAAGKLPESCKVKGLMVPAREVGGDLYDFFMMDADRLGLVIADVSDKGVPSALFMATAKMCIKDNMMLGAEPEEVLRRVNTRLLESNKSRLFVTAWIAELNLKNGNMKYASAGHPFPFIRRAGSNEYVQLRSDRNLVLSGIYDFPYRQEETVLNPGDRLFMYTDGLDEARDIHEGFFGKERIKTYLDLFDAVNIADTVSGIKATVDEYAAGREQFDDLTILMAEYCGGKKDE